MENLVTYAQIQYWIKSIAYTRFEMEEKPAGLWVKLSDNENEWVFELIESLNPPEKATLLTLLEQYRWDGLSDYDV